MSEAPDPEEEGALLICSCLALAILIQRRHPCLQGWHQGYLAFLNTTVDSAFPVARKQGEPFQRLVTSLRKNACRAL